MNLSDTAKYIIMTIVFFTTIILYFFVFEGYSYQKKFTLAIGAIILLVLNLLWNKEEHKNKYKLIYRILLYSCILILAFSSFYSK